MNINVYLEEIKYGKPAQARVGSILRGGFLIGKTFYYCGLTPEKTDDYSELELREKDGFYRGDPRNIKKK